MGVPRFAFDHGDIAQICTRTGDGAVIPVAGTAPAPKLIADKRLKRRHPDLRDLQIGPATGTGNRRW
jgi:hypothetical protein